MAFDDNGQAARHILTVEDIFAVDDIEERIVEVPQWGGAVRIRAFSLKQVQDMRKASTGMNPATHRVEVDNDELEARMFTAGIVEPKFEFTDYARLRDKSVGAIQIVMRAIVELSGISDEAISEATKSPANGTAGTLPVPARTRARRNDAS